MSFKKGQSGNPNGRPKGSKNKVTSELYDAIKAIEKEKGKALFKHFVERGYKNDKVLIALIRKLVPDKLQTDIDLDADIIFKLLDVDISKFPKKNV